jgi:hypothetical protein
VELAFGRRWKTEAESEQLLRFAAFIAAYNEEPATASLAWEKLGQVELAITQARLAGDLERAFHLLRKTGAAIPEELSVAVKLARLAEQLPHQAGSPDAGRAAAPRRAVGRADRRTRRARR